MKGLFAYSLVLTLLVSPSIGQFGNGLLYLTRLIGRISTACPGNTSPASCECDNDPSLIITAPFGTPPFGPLKILGCSPSFCKCPEDGPEVNMRSEETLRFMNLCPRGKMAGCECADGKFTPIPFDFQTLYSQCRPVKCRCKGDPALKTVTVFGCRTGGTMSCTGNGEFGCKDRDGKVQAVSTNDILGARLKKTCVCSADGMLPICTGDGNPPTCPDGSVPDFSLGSPGSGLSECKKPPGY